MAGKPFGMFLLTVLLNDLLATLLELSAVFWVESCAQLLKKTNAKQLLNGFKMPKKLFFIRNTPSLFFAMLKPLSSYICDLYHQYKH